MKTQAQPLCKSNNSQKLIISATLALAAISATTICAYSQGNNFFGTNAGGSGSSTGSSGSTDYSHDLPEDSNPNAVLPGLNETTASNPNAMGSDFTGDEKRMQKKYKSNIVNANNLIAKGTQMMKSSESNQNSPVFKRGKILKEIGEKSLANLKANNPFPSQKVK